MLEKKLPAQEIKRWPGKMPVSYLYTAGLAGERFFQEIKEQGRLIGPVCPKCDSIYLPPRFYCERCFSTLTKWRVIPKKGTLATYTLVYLDLDENLLPEPEMVGFITFKGVTGGLIHKIGRAKPEELKIGLVVQPVFEEKEKRRGSILDIKYFQPV